MHARMWLFAKYLVLTYRSQSKRLYVALVVWILNTYGLLDILNFGNAYT